MKTLTSSVFRWIINIKRILFSIVFHLVFYPTLFRTKIIGIVVIINILTAVFTETFFIHILNMIPFFIHLSILRFFILHRIIKMKKGYCDGIVVLLNDKFYYAYTWYSNITRSIVVMTKTQTAGWHRWHVGTHASEKEKNNKIIDKWLLPGIEG